MKIARTILFFLTIGTLCCPALSAAVRTWVFFKDKGYETSADLSQALRLEENRLLPLTKARLLKVRNANALLCENDLPVFPAYLKQIETITGQKPHAVSRILNATSFTLSEAQIEIARSLPCVASLKPVRSFRSESEPYPQLAPQKSSPRTVLDSLLYGDSYLQNQIGNFPPAHEAGYTGQGVMVGMLDAGWDTLQHPCFSVLEIVVTRDFVNGDSSVANDPGQQGEGSHGTKTLSCIAGYDPGDLIGTAYGISVALAKTENTVGERLIEEDNWISGIEWLDSLGCQVVSSSVSYYDFDNGFSYTYQDLDGNTTPITIAADYEVQRGIVVVNSMGNRGNYTYPNNKMKVPADGDSVLSIGAVEGDSARATFSSMGPTYDGRLKPDLVALGNSVKVAVRGVYPYSYGSGTSFSTPITAGACALLLQADPQLTPMQVHTYLKNSASQATNPDTLIGWGVFDVWRAIQDVLNAATRTGVTILPADFNSLFAYPNPFNASTLIYLTLSTPGRVTLNVYDLAGRKVANLTNRSYPLGLQRITWEAENLPSGLYLLRAETAQSVQTCRVVLLK